MIHSTPGANIMSTLSQLNCVKIFNRNEKLLMTTSTQADSNRILKVINNRQQDKGNSSQNVGNSLTLSLQICNFCSLALVTEIGPNELSENQKKLVFNIVLG